MYIHPCLVWRVFVMRCNGDLPVWYIVSKFQHMQADCFLFFFNFSCWIKLHDGIQWVLMLLFKVSCLLVALGFHTLTPTKIELLMSGGRGWVPTHTNLDIAMLYYVSYNVMTETTLIEMIKQINTWTRAYRDV